MHRVEIVSDGTLRYGCKTTSTEVLVDGKQIHGVKSIDFHQDIETYPTFKFETKGFPKININRANVIFEFSPKTVEDSIKVLRNALITDSSLYSAFLSSIRSVIHEHLESSSVEQNTTDDLSAKILKRIIGTD